MNQYLPSFCHTYPVLRDWLNQYLPSFCHLSSITHNIAQVSSSCHSITSFNMYFNTSNSNDLYHKSRTCQYSVRQHQLTINRIDQSIFCPQQFLHMLCLYSGTPSQSRVNNISKMHVLFSNNRSTVSNL